MIIDLTKLNNNIEKSISVNKQITFSNEELTKADLISLNDVVVTGEITKSSVDHHIYLNVSGTMVLSCAVTLKPVDYPFNLEITEDLSELLKENDKNIKKNENTIDILPIIWENILVEIPMKVVSEDADISQLEGVGWKVITEEVKTKNINPELEKLKDLL